MRFRAGEAYLRTDRRPTVQLARVSPAPQTKWTFTMRTEQKVAVCVGRDRAIGHRADRRQRIAVTFLEMWFPADAETAAPAARMQAGQSLDASQADSVVSAC